jgi:hypothetical protein
MISAVRVLRMASTVALQVVPETFTFIGATVGFAAATPTIGTVY